MKRKNLWNYKLANTHTKTFNTIKVFNSEINL